MTTPATSGSTWQDLRVSLGADAEVTGKLSFSTPTRIEGRLKGELKSSSMLVVGKEGVVHASVQADQLIVLGEVRGDVHATARVEVHPGGRVIGDVRTGCLVVKEGAVLEGGVKMNNAAAAPRASSTA
ncbi:MAG TPA: polymer-forming cytoskeletal protein [Candidatus Limnocylindria bacterium]|nr:polymer-forming cytoskeletal protein [Candidatus Limnocylindria bacterium]